MCYNVATNKIWSDIFKIKTMEDIKERITSVYSTINYVFRSTNWNTDQLDLYKYVMNWNEITQNLVVLNDGKTGYSRLDRNWISLDERTINNIKNGSYSDYHCLRPFKQHESINNKIYELLELLTDAWQLKK